MFFKKNYKKTAEFGRTEANAAGGQRAANFADRQQPAWDQRRICLPWGLPAVCLAVCHASRVK
jgi:hypothetical protein